MLRGPTSSSCKGIFFYFLGRKRAHFRPFSSNIDNLKEKKKRKPKNPKNSLTKSKIPQKNLKNTKHVKEKKICKNQENYFFLYLKIKR